MYLKLINKCLGFKINETKTNGTVEVFTIDEKDIQCVSKEITFNYETISFCS